MCFFGDFLTYKLHYSLHSTYIQTRPHSEVKNNILVLFFFSREFVRLFCTYSSPRFTLFSTRKRLAPQILWHCLAFSSTLPKSHYTTPQEFNTILFFFCLLGLSF